MFIAHLTLIFSVQFAVIALVLFFKKQSRRANVLLGLVMAILGFQHFMHYLWATRAVYTYPWLLNIDLPLDACIGPLLYFYIRVLTGVRDTFKPVHLLHFWPLPLGLLWYVVFNLQTTAQQTDFINHAYTDVPLAAVIVTVQLAIYLGLGYRQLDRYIKGTAHTQWVTGYSNLAWLRQLMGILFVLNVIFSPLNLIAKFSYIIAGFPVVTAFVLLFVFYQAVNHPEVLGTELIRKFSQQLEYQRELEKVRMQISQDIHDELGAGLTQIAMTGQLTNLQQKPDTPTAKAIEKMVATSHQLMNQLREVVWAINPAHDNMESLQAFLRNYISTFFEATTVQVRMNFEEMPDALPPGPGVRRNLALIVKEAANNIVKHAGATQVQFNLRADNACVYLTIADNGKGLAPTGTTNGNGLKNMQKRAEAVGGQFTLQSSTTGLTLQVKMPLARVT